MKRILPLLLLALSFVSQARPQTPGPRAWWTSTSSMTVARWGHTATLLNNGTVLIVGGANDRRAEVYDPASGTFSVVGSTLSNHLQNFSATALADGTILVVGGDGAPNSAETYDPSSKTFTAAGSTNAQRSCHTATLLPGGQVLIAGGYPLSSENSAEIYDPVNRTFTLVAHSLNAYRMGPSASLLSNGKVLIAGGQDTSTSPAHCLNSTELYDIAAQTFTPGPSATQIGCYPRATLLPDGRVLLTVWNVLAEDIYDPVTNSFTYTGPETSFRQYETDTLLKSGQVLVAGGAGAPVTNNSAMLFDPTTKAFTATAPMSQARLEHTATLLPDGRVLVAGGCAQAGTNCLTSVLNSAEIYELPYPPVYVSTNSNQILIVDGTNGATNVLYTDLNENALSGLAVGPDNLIYAAVPSSNRIIRIDQSGGSLATVYDRGNDPNGPNGPEGPSFGTSRQLTFNTEDNEGVWQISFGSSDNPLAPVQMIPPVNGTIRGAGTTFNHADELLIVDQYPPDGNSVGDVRQQTAPGLSTTTTLISSVYLSWPVGVAVNSSGNIFVSDWACDAVCSGYIRQFDPAGNPVNPYVTFPNEQPWYIQFDASDKLYVVTQDASANGKVYRVDPSGSSPPAGAATLLVDLGYAYSNGTIPGLNGKTAVGLALPATTYTTPQQPVSPGTSTTFTNGTTISETVLLPPDVDMGGAAYKSVSFIEVPPAVFNSTRLPGIAQDPNWSDGSTPIPATTTCTVIAGTGGNCVVIRDLCFDANHNPILPCNITAPTTLIQLTSQYKTQSPQCSPGYVIADDDQRNWANITTSYNPTDITIGGGTKGLNTDTTVVDLAPASCGSPSSDTGPPVTTVVTSPEPNNSGWNMGPVTVILTSTDDTLVKQIDYSINGVSQPTVLGASTLFQITCQGMTSISYQATDEVGNKEALKTLAVMIDTTPPVVTVTGVTSGATYPLGAVPTAGCSTTDAISGVATPASLTLAGGVPPGVGTFTATCSGAVDKAGNQTAPVIATYYVTAGPVAGVSPSSITFGTVYLGTITTKNLTVTNQGDAPMTITNPLLSIVSGGNSKEFVAVNLCPKTLAAGKSCTISVSFVAGPFYSLQTAMLKVMDNAPYTLSNPQTVALSATVINPQAQLSASRLSFGTQKVKTSSAAKAVTLKNTGATALTINSIAITGTDPLDFVQTNNCPGSLAANISCTVNVTFKPTAGGLRSASVVITDNAQNSPQNISLSGTGD